MGKREKAAMPDAWGGGSLTPIPPCAPRAHLITASEWPLALSGPLAHR